MPADPLLSSFDPALLRLILCGGGGLPAAWGPLVLPDGQIDVWAGQHAIATGNCGEPGFWSFGATDKPWRLPLDHWRPRLAVVAAWMLGIEARAADIDGDLDGVVLIVWTGATARDVIRMRAWDSVTGGSGNAPDLPSLPRHLLTHDPVVALLLALFDVPEIRAKVEALNG